MKLTRDELKELRKKFMKNGQGNWSDYVCEAQLEKVLQKLNEERVREICRKARAVVCSPGGKTYTGSLDINTVNLLVREICGGK